VVEQDVSGQVDDGQVGGDEHDAAAGGTRCGFIALVGAPNAGKSTLLNALTGAKVSIVSPKVQTTRARVLGITIEGATQLVFVDTPGIFQPKRRLDRAMVAAAWQGADESDKIAVLYDSARKKGIDEDTRRIIGKLKQEGRKALLILNKIDLIQRDKLLGLAAEFDAEGIFDEIFMVSATTGDGLDRLRSYLAERAPEGPWHYPEDHITDMPMRLLAAEITREKLFLQLHQELPYATTVETELWEQFDDGSVKISQVIYVRKDGQKAIVLGKGGTRIRAVGEASRRELEEFMEQRIHLKLFVKVRDDWEEDPERYAPWGLDHKA
jgi:GTPase